MRVLEQKSQSKRKLAAFFTRAPRSAGNFGRKPAVQGCHSKPAVLSGYCVFLVTHWALKNKPYQEDREFVAVTDKISL